MSNFKAKINHIGIAVSDLEDSARTLKKLFGIEFGPTEEVKQQGVKVSFSKEDDIPLELVQATTLKSPIMPLLGNPIKTFLERTKTNTGIHHICLEVDSLEEELIRLSSEGVRRLSSMNLKGHGDHEVCFLDPRDTQGLLIELIEIKRKGGDCD